MIKKKLLNPLLCAIILMSCTAGRADYTGFFDECVKRVVYSLIDITVVAGGMYFIVKYIMPFINGDSMPLKPSVPTSKLSDIVGSHPKEMITFLDMIKSPEKYRKNNINIARSILFYGPPGNGKTEYARAIANELNAVFYEMPSAAVFNKFFGQSSQNIRTLFETVRADVKAKVASKSVVDDNAILAVIFLDEIDALGRSRQFYAHDSISGESQAALTTLLAELTKHNENKHILIIGATNLKSSLDPALTRPGRFDLSIEIPLPNVADRAKILEHYANKFMVKIKDADKNSFFVELAQRTAGFNNAELKELCNKVALIAVHSARSSISMRHFDAAIQLMRPGRSVTQSPKEPKIVESRLKAA